MKNFREKPLKNPSSCTCWTKRLGQVSKYHLKIQKMLKQWIRKISPQWHFNECFKMYSSTCMLVLFFALCMFVNRTFLLSWFVFPLQIMCYSQENCSFIHVRNYSFIYTQPSENLKARILKSIITWSVMGQQTTQWKMVYCHDCSVLFILDAGLDILYNVISKVAGYRQNH